MCSRPCAKQCDADRTGGLGPQDALCFKEKLRHINSISKYRRKNKCFRVFIVFGEFRIGIDVSVLGGFGERLTEEVAVEVTG